MLLLSEEGNEQDSLLSKEINKIPYSRVYQIHRRQRIYSSHETDYEEKC